MLGIKYKVRFFLRLIALLIVAVGFLFEHNHNASLLREVVLAVKPDNTSPSLEEYIVSEPEGTWNLNAPPIQELGAHISIEQEPISWEVQACSADDIFWTTEDILSSTINEFDYDYVIPVAPLTIIDSTTTDTIVEEKDFIEGFQATYIGPVIVKHENPYPFNRWIIVGCSMLFFTFIPRRWLPDFASSET